MLVCTSPQTRKDEQVEKNWGIDWTRLTWKMAVRMELFALFKYGNTGIITFDCWYDGVVDC